MHLAKIGLILAAAILTLTPLSRAGTIPTPLVQYTFEEASGAAINSGSAADADGTLNGTAQRTAVGGSFGSVLDTHGGDGSNYLSASAANIQNLSTFTLVTWFNLQAPLSTFDRLIAMHNTSGGGFDWFFVDTTDVQLTVDGTDASNRKPANLNTNTWYFLAVSYDGTKTTNNVTFYLGTLTDPVSSSGTASRNAGTVDTTASGTELRIGGTQRTASDRTPDAWFDDVQIYGSILSLSDLESLRSVALVAAPEPAGLSLLGLGATALLARRRR